MRPQSVAPGDRPSRTPAALNAVDLTQLVSPYVLAQLEAEGVRTLKDWSRLGRRRLEIFGVPRSLARHLDELAKG